MHPSDFRRSIPPLAWPRTCATVCGILILALQPIIFFRRVLINPSEHIPYDLAGFHLPLISYVAQCVRQGIAPLWDPYPYCGAPIHADIQAQVFYPFTWVAILAGNHSQGRNLFYWVEWLIPAHMILAGLFAFWLLRRMGLRHPAVRDSQGGVADRSSGGRRLPLGRRDRRRRVDPHVAARKVQHGIAAGNLVAVRRRNALTEPGVPFDSEPLPRLRPRAIQAAVQLHRDVCLLRNRHHGSDCAGALRP